MLFCFFAEMKEGRNKNWSTNHLNYQFSIKPARWLSRFPEIVSGRFLCFALIFSRSPQNLCRFHLIY
jgi:hypothetical protein